MSSMEDRWGDTTGRAQSTMPNFQMNTLEEDAAAGGWTRITAPTVPPGGRPPDRATTAGMRGESQIDDDTLPGPGDQSAQYGS